MKLSKSATSIGLCLALLTASISSQASSPDGLWISSSSLNNSAMRSVAPNSRVNELQADMTALKNALWKSPMEGATQGQEVFLPLPDGTFVRVEAFEFNMMEKKLADQFPELKNFKVRGLDDPSISGHLTYSRKGFHGMLKTFAGIIYIDPDKSKLTKGKLPNQYRSFQLKKSDASAQCRVDHQEEKVIESASKAKSASKGPLDGRQNGTKLNELRIAVGTTVEYTAAVGPSKSDALTAVNVAIARVNLIFEQDFGIRLNLIGDNLDLIYNSGDSSPLQDSSLSIDAFTTRFDNEVGSASYDIGHVFSAVSDGLAYLRSVCGYSTPKAGAYTGQPAVLLETDSFYVDYLAHELGHQFGANHTFNGNSCGSSNRSSSAAYEPGSASTIMGYAGLCGDEDLQNFSDPYFHVHSIDEVLDFIADIETEEGSNPSFECLSQAAVTDNDPPSADAGDDFTIPAETPFMLTAAGSDPDDDDNAITFTWEQMDLGSASNNESSMHTDSGNRPIIRSVTGSTDPVRHVPQFDDLIAGTNTTGIRLPTTSRTLNFKLTTRSGHRGIATDLMAVTSTTTAGPFEVTAPAAGSYLIESTSADILWSVNNTDLSPVSCANVDILYATDGGSSYDSFSTLLSSTPNDGSQSVTLPSGLTTTARVLVKCSDNIFYNVNSGNFNVIDDTTSVLSLSADQNALNEGSTGSTNFTFTVTRQGSISGTASANWSLSNIDTLSDDFTGSTSGTVNFAASDTSETITISVSGDTEFEDDESFSVVLSSPVDALLSVSSVSSTISNDDADPDTGGSGGGGGGQPEPDPEIPVIEAPVEPEEPAEEEPVVETEPTPVASSSGGGGSLSFAMLAFLLLLSSFKSISASRLFLKKILLVFTTTTVLALSSCAQGPLSDSAPHMSSLTANNFDENSPEFIHPSIRSLLWIENADPVLNVQHALSRNDTKFWAGGGRGTLNLPGISSDDLEKAKSFGIKYQEGISDVLISPRHGELYKTFIKYAEEYNQLLKTELGF